jgi:hypothetical protein
MEGRVVPVTDVRSEYNTLPKNLTRKDHLGVDEKIILSAHLREEVYEGVGWILLTQSEFA